jgi:hypothetical protein
VALHFLIPAWSPVAVSGTLGGRALFLLGVSAAGTAVYIVAARVFAERELRETLSAIRQGFGTILRRGEEVPLDNGVE